MPTAGARPGAVSQTSVSSKHPDNLGRNCHALPCASYQRGTAASQHGTGPIVRNDIILRFSKGAGGGSA
jgi:hypothetical protein